MTEILGVVEVLAVPGQMFAGHSNPGMFPIKPVQFVQVAEHNITQFEFAKLSTFRRLVYELVEFAKDPRPPLGGTADHQSVAIR